MLRLARICAALTCAGAALALAAAAAQSNVHAPRCGPVAARTLAAGASARVYALHGDVYGCSVTTGVRTRLGTTASCIGAQRVGPVALAGQIAAYGLESCGVDTGSTVIVTRRLADGQTLVTLPALTGPVGPESYEMVGSLAVKSDGACAWIASARSIVRTLAETEVHRSEPGGFALLDSGAAIVPGSLRLRGSALSWRHGALLRSATLS